MTATKDITIQGVIFAVAAPYAAGEAVLTEAEANALNQTRAENIRNNFATKVKTARESVILGDTPEGETADLSADALKKVELPKEILEELAFELANYDEAYEFTMASAGGGRAPVDPIQKEALKMAKDAVAGILRGKGLTLKAYLEIEGNKQRYDEAVAQVAAQDGYQKAAKKTVAEREKLASVGIDELVF